MTMAASTRRVLVPAAGFGKRAGSPPAKELLPDPETGRPLIEFALERAREANAEPLVITRSAKVELVAALVEYGVETLSIEPSREWPDTLLQAEAQWCEHNLVLLPDTRYAPLDAAEKMFRALKGGADVVYATFDVEDFSTWGVIAKSGEAWSLAEKPAAASAGAMAWGIFGFQRGAGRALLEAKLESTVDHNWKLLRGEVATINLNSFVDLTR